MVVSANRIKNPLIINHERRSLIPRVDKNSGENSWTRDFLPLNITISFPENHVIHEKDSQHDEDKTEQNNDDGNSTAKCQSQASESLTISILCDNSRT